CLEGRAPRLCGGQARPLARPAAPRSCPCRRAAGVDEDARGGRRAQGPGGAARMHGVARAMVGGLSAVHGRVARAPRPCGARLAPQAHGWPRLTIVGRAQ
ncbi:MAG: hypothetical protein LC769_12400, partial [Chloroflexi bacterium]|nr:hypothetical protein [Chloroflexota bacterium]